jgi:hypothetical protein
MDLRRGPAGLRGRSAGRQGGRDAGAAGVQGLGQHGQFLDLLDGEGQPLAYLGVDRRLQIEVDRRVQQRARRRQDHPVAAARRDHRLQPVEQGLQIRAPDIAAVDHPQRQHQALTTGGQNGLKVFRRAGQVDMHPFDGQVDGGDEIVAIAAEIAGQQQAQLRRGMGESAIGAAKLGPVEIGQVQSQARLVDLHPVGARNRQALQ